jgi:hypothetical protein
MNPGDCSQVKTLVSDVVTNSIIIAPDPVLTDSQTFSTPIKSSSLLKSKNPSIASSTAQIQTRTPTVFHTSFTTVFSASASASTAQLVLTTQVVLTTEAVSITQAAPTSVSLTTAGLQSFTNSTIATDSNTLTEPTSKSVAESTKSLSSGTKAGIGAGTGVGTMTLVGLLLYFIIKRRRRIAEAKLFTFPAFKKDPNLSKIDVTSHQNAPRKVVGQPTGAMTLNERDEWISGIHPRLGSMKSQSIHHLPQLP